jgi:[protein-PII] uridylyltransferase
MPLLQLDTDRLLEQLRQARHAGTCAREWLDEGQKTLDDAFPATPITELVQERARMVDTVLEAAWHLFALNDAPLALVAVGGYGRGELHPHSDVDLLILLASDTSDKEYKRLEEFVAFLWDIGLEIGHSVRTLEQCVAMARDDITVATNIMESRTLAGPDALRQELEERTRPEHMWSPAEFFAAKWDEQLGRHRKYNDTEYNLEPDIKNAPGGLRDIQMVGWVTRRHFGEGELEALVRLGFLREYEYGILKKCQDHLWQIRWALHRISGRNENRLLFDYQRQVAALFGYEDSDANLAVEQFMKRYYRVALALSVLNEVLLQLFDEAILKKDQPQSVRPLSRHFQVRNDYIEVTADDTFQKHPSALLEIFLFLARDPEIRGVRASTVRMLFEQRKLIDDDFRADKRNAALFMELLRSPNALFTQLRRMKRYGILGQYLPEFGRIIGMMQYDLFHIYTVDAHTLLVVKNMRKLRHEDTREEYPLACDVFYRLPKPELLYVAGLYHDIAKGRGGDHSELGADDAIDFCRRHGLTSWDAKLSAWLVKNHLLMSVTAQRKDISDPAVVHDFARKVGDLVHLDYLYVLTVADINATNPALWNSWRASLLRQLYTETKRALRRGLNNPPDKQDWIDETRDEALKLLEQTQVTRAQVEELWSGIGEEYFLRENARDIAWHTEAMIKRGRSDDPMVLLRESAGAYEGGTQIFVYTPDTENLFAATVNALTQLSLTIMDARIITSADGFSLDTYIVLDEHGTPIGDNPQRIRQIQETLTETLRNPAEFADIVQRRMPRRNKHFDVPTQVVISNDLGHEHTVVDIQTLDRPGLLARIGRIFADFRLLVHNARIATLGERAEDVFFVTDQTGEPVSDPELCEQLRAKLTSELDDTSDQQPSAINI